MAKEMTRYIRQKDVLKRLEEDGIVVTTKQAFSQSVYRGSIPSKPPPEGQKHKRFDYAEVLHRIKSDGMFGYVALQKTDEGYSISDLKDRLESNPTLADANTLKAIIASSRDELKLKEEQGLLITKAEVEDKAFIVARVIRDKVMTLPERLANELAVVSEAHVIKEMLYREFSLILDTLSEESFINADK